MTEPEADPPTCPWCGAPAVLGATRCSACGAAIAQRESIGDLQIPGLTSVDPALVDYDKRPLHIPGPSPSQGVAPALIIGAVAGGPIGIAAIGGVVALSAAEFMGTKVGGPDGIALEDLGKPSDLMFQALEHADAQAGGAAAPAPLTAAETPVTDAAAADNGMSIWRDLPPETESEGPDVPPVEAPPASPEGSV